MEKERQCFWTRNSSILLGRFFITIFLIGYIWWPLAEEVLSYIDWNGEFEAHDSLPCPLRGKGEHNWSYFLLGRV